MLYKDYIAGFYGYVWKKYGYSEEDVEHVSHLERYELHNEYILVYEGEIGYTQDQTEGKDAI